MRKPHPISAVWSTVMSAQLVTPVQRTTPVVTSVPQLVPVPISLVTSPASGYDSPLAAASLVVDVDEEPPSIPSRSSASCAQPVLAATATMPAIVKKGNATEASLTRDREKWPRIPWTLPACATPGQVFAS